MLHDARHALFRFMTENLRENRHCTHPRSSRPSFSTMISNIFFAWARLISCCGKKSWATPYSLSPPISKPSFLQTFLKFVGDLKKDTDTITGFSFCILTSTMLKILYDLKSIGNCIMCFLSFYINNGSDTAVIMFKFRR
mgnify:CR=1 FL=1